MARHRVHSAKTKALKAKAARRREREAKQLAARVRQEKSWGTSAVLYRNHMDGIEYREAAEDEGRHTDIR